MTLIKRTSLQLICILLACWCANLCYAQKGSQNTITKEQMNQIDQVTKPAKLTVDAILQKDKTGTY